MRARPALALLAPVVAAATLAAAPAPAAAEVGPDLAGVPVDGEEAADAQAAYDEVFARLTAAIAARTNAEAELATLAARDVELTTEIAAATERRKAASLRLVAARRAILEAAASAYVTSATASDEARLFDVDETNEVGTVQELSEAVREDRQRELDAARAAVEAASAAVQRAHDERVEVRDRQVAVTEARDRAAADEAAATDELAVRLWELQQARAVARVSGTDFALVALDAYLRAAESQPACGIPWWAIAGISRVEGRHGTYGGSSLTADGQVTRPIIGIPLDGTNNTRAIGDTDSGALDGDPVVDRAVGPMQFIPSTWARWGRDGDGDGDEDPQNLYDATAAAAAYLCNGRRLTDDDGLRAAYFSYNRSEAYVESVLAYAHGYARLRIPEPPPPPPVAPRPPA